MRFTFIKKTLTVVSLLVVATQFGYTQTCVVDTTNFELISPATDKLLCIERGVPYQQVLQLFTPPSIAGSNIDSIMVTVFNGLPSGITTTCIPGDCTMSGYERACIVISGITNDTAGVYPIDYDGTVYTDQGDASFDYLRTQFPLLPEYSMNVIDSGANCVNYPDTVVAGISAFSNTTFLVYPNPANGQLIVELSATNQLAEISIVDMAGRVLFISSDLLFATTKIAVNTSQYTKGLYFVQYKTKEGIACKKIVIE